MEPLGSLQNRLWTRAPYVKPYIPRILSGPFIIRVPFFLIFSFNKGTLNQKGQKGTTQEPRYTALSPPLNLKS